MTDLRLYNTLTRSKQVFVPADPARVTMYVCGPTVYGRAHIGNARPAVVFDVLRRVLRHRYGQTAVVYARNITDIDDKIITAADAEGVPIDTITKRFEGHYLADMGALGVEPPDHAPHATAYVTQMVAMIGELVERGVAYAAEGHVLFDVGSFADYGKLSGRRLDEMIAGARVEVAPYKKSPADFVLWKPSWPEQPGWDSPWGRGRPGWHIECSAMIREVLGETIDVHGGGLDLIFPHHENEAAQSACAHGGAPLARVWMHNGFLSMGADKMSKSLGNVALIDELLAAGWSGEVLRLALLSAHYRQPLEWTSELLSNSKTMLNSWYKVLDYGRVSTVTAKHVDNDVEYALSNDLNTPLAISALGVLATRAEEQRQAAFYYYAQDNLKEGERSKRSFRDLSRRLLASGRLLGLLRKTPTSWFRGSVDSWFVEAKLQARAVARARKNFEESDRIRAQLEAAGVVLEDGSMGTTWRRA